MAAPVRVFSALVIALAVAGPLAASSAEGTCPFDLAFNLSSFSRNESLLTTDRLDNAHRAVRHKVWREAGGLREAGLILPYTFAVYSGFSVSPPGFSQGIEGTLPFIAWFSVVLRGDLGFNTESRGYTGEVGLRGTISLMDPSVFPVGTRWHGGRSTDFRLHIDSTVRVGRLLYDRDDFSQFNVTGESSVWGPTTRLGIDYGEYVRVFAGATASYLMIATNKGTRYYRTTVGLEVGIRFCFN